MVIPPRQKDAKKPKPGTCLVEGISHYGRFMKGERYAVSQREVATEMEKPGNEQRFSVLARGEKKPSASRIGKGVGLRNAVVD